jgi:hypothetical protein
MGDRGCGCGSEAGMNDGDSIILQNQVQATCIHVWRRGAPGVRWVMSISSGPKDMFMNDAMLLMDRNSHVDAVALMLLPGPQLLYLQEIGGRWYDCQGVEAQIARAA